MRTILIKQNTDLKALSGMLIQQNAAAGQAQTALQALQALNPHVDINAIRPGTVLLVPDGPSINTAGTEPVAGNSADDLQQVIHTSLTAAAERLRAGNAAAAADRSAIATVLKAAPFKRIVDSDATLKQQVADATKTFKDDQKQDDADEKAVTEAIKTALSSFADLRKLLG